MVGVAFICCTFVAKIKCHTVSLFGDVLPYVDLIYMDVV